MGGEGGGGVLPLLGLGGGAAGGDGGGAEVGVQGCVGHCLLVLGDCFLGGLYGFFLVVWWLERII